jgi:S-DNA-T family DNA segregation ATPase FtsK/SpoIIIE
MQSTHKAQRPARPLAGIGLMIGGLYTSLSLLSYSAQDPSWNFARSDDSPLSNWGGLVGSYLADSFLQVLGLVAYALAIGAVLAGFRFLSPRSLLLLEAAQLQKTARWRIPVALSLLSLSSAALLSLLPWTIYGGISLGGILGYWISAAGTFCFSTVGASLLFFGLLWAGLYLLTNRAMPTKIPQINWKRPQITLPAVSLKPLLERFKKKSGSEQAPQVHQPEVPVSTQKKLDELFARKVAEPEKEIEQPQSQLNLFDKARSLFSDTNEDAIHTDPQTDRVLLMKVAPTRKQKPKNPKQTQFELPSLQLLDLPMEKGHEISRDELIANSKALEQKLMDFGIQGHVTNIRPGPIITLYEFEPAPGVKVKNITNLTDDLKLAMKAVSIRILAPIPGRAAVGIEIPNPRRQTVFLREILQSPLFLNASSPLVMGMGKTTSGDAYVTDLSKMPHLLIAGATGSGKSVGLNAMVVSMLFKATPDELKMIMIDPKMLELSVYDGIPHLLLPVVTDPKKAARALSWAVKEMERRYKLISSLGARNLKSYNDKVAKLSESELKKELEKAAHAEATTSAIIEDDEASTTKAQESALQEAGLDTYVQLPYICVVIDELADLIMVAAHDVEESIARLAQMARAAGIHLIIATQRPSVDVITGVIKANLPTRCAFQVASKVDSRTIIDGSGAENLIGEGDMLFLPPGTSRLERLHGPFISEDEIARVVRHLKAQGSPDYSTEINLEESRAAEANAGEDDIDDGLYDQALTVVFETKSPSASMLQRRLRVGYNRAARLIERMEREGVVSPPIAGGKGRELLITPSHE